MINHVLYILLSLLRKSQNDNDNDNISPIMIGPTKI